MSNSEKEYRLIPYEGDEEHDRIRLSDIISSVWSSRKLLLYITIAFALYGVIRSLATPEEFTSSASLMPNAEQGAQLPSMLQQFSGIIGNLQSQPGQQISTQLYPEIIFSKRSLYHLMYLEIHVPELDSTMDVRSYLEDHRPVSTMATVTGFLLKYTVHLPITLLEALRQGVAWAASGGDGSPSETVRSVSTDRSDGLGRRYRLSVAEVTFMQELTNRVETNFNNETGLFEVSVKMPNPEVSADMTESVIEYLTNYITEYRTEKLVRNLEFIEERYNEVEKEFIEAQQKLAEFRDRNVNLTSARVQSEEERLRSDYQLKFNLFNGIAQQREEAKLRLQEETPVFKVMEPVSVPSTRSSPRRTMMVILFTIFGFLFGLAAVYTRQAIWPLFRANRRQN